VGRCFLCLEDYLRLLYVKTHVHEVWVYQFLYYLLVFAEQYFNRFIILDIFLVILIEILTLPQLFHQVLINSQHFWLVNEQHYLDQTVVNQPEYNLLEVYQLDRLNLHVQE
jgi:hypothetical protein